MSSIAVSVDNLTKKFGDFTAVSNVSFQIEKGEIFGFLGANGAGKSTTIRMLCGIMPPSSGQAIVAGYDVLREPRKVRQSIGYMSQKFSLYDELTVLENMTFFAKLYSVPLNIFNYKIKETIEKVSLQGYENTKAISLSAGIKQRLALACAIIHEPKIIFLDEPTSGVDPITRRSFWDLIYSFSAKGVTIFVTTHYMDEAEYCDRIAMISSGTLREIGTPTQLKVDKMIWDVYKITNNDLYKTASVLSGKNNIFDVGILSDSVRLLCTNYNKDTINDILISSGLVNSSIEKVEASLEDVFVSLSGRKV